MPIVGGRLPDDVAALLARALPALRWQRAAAQGDVAAVIVGAGAALPVPLVGAELHDAGRGHLCGVLARGAVAAAARAVAPSIAAALDEPVESDQVWCLVLAPSGPVLVPLRLSPPSLGRAARGSA